MKSRRALVGAAVATALMVLSSSCGSGTPCVTSRSVTAHCADLDFEGRSYDEWHKIGTPGLLQEIGDASYPSCNASTRCHQDELGGFGATDVWLLDGVAPERAVIGLRQDTDTYVIFVRVGVDPGTLHLRPDRPG